MKPVVFTPAAEDDLAEAVVWYENERPGRGVRFRDAVLAARDLIAAQPAIGARVPRTPARRVILTAFPYSLVYTETTDEIRIAAVVHARRRTRYWKDRLRPD